MSSNGPARDPLPDPEKDAPMAYGSGYRPVVERLQASFVIRDPEFPDNALVGVGLSRKFIRRRRELYVEIFLDCSPVEGRRIGVGGSCQRI